MTKLPATSNARRTLEAYDSSARPAAFVDELHSDNRSRELTSHLVSRDIKTRRSQSFVEPSAGDVSLQAKPLDRMRRYRRQGATMLRVSHSIETVRPVCDRAVWLDRDRVRQVRPADAACAAYRAA